MYFFLYHKENNVHLKITSYLQIINTAKVYIISNTNVVITHFKRAI